MFTIFPSRQLEIVGQTYLLSIIPQQDTESNIWRFQLQNKIKGALIPGGFKLRLLTECGESFPCNEVVATKRVETLDITITLKSGTVVRLEIEPIPENMSQEIWIF